MDAHLGGVCGRERAAGLGGTPIHDYRENRRGYARFADAARSRPADLLERGCGRPRLGRV
jgi:hypothetical protein